MKKQTAQSDFIKSFLQLQSDMDRIKEASKDHFNKNPDEINWGDAGSMRHLAEQMREISDQIFNEGEYK